MPLEEYEGLMERWGLTFGKLWPFLLLLTIIFVAIIFGVIWIAVNQYGEGMSSFQG